MNFVVIISAASFASAFALRAVDPVIPVIARDFGVSIGDAALLISAFGFPYALSQPIMGPVADSIGKSRIIRSALFILFACTLMAALADSLDGLFLARLAAGAFSGGVIPVSMALVGDRIPLDQRQFTLSRLLIANISGQMAGAAVSGVVVDHFGWRAVFAVVAFLIALACLLALYAFRDFEDRTGPFTIGSVAANYRRLFSSRYGLFIMFGVMFEGIFAFGLFPFMAAVIARHGAQGATEAGLVLGCFAIGGILYALAVRPLLRRLSPPGMILTGALVCAAGYLATLLPVHWTIFMPIFIFAGFGFFMMHNTLQTLATEALPDARAAAVALFSTFFFLGQALGPIVGGAITDMVGAAQLYAVAALFIALLGVVGRFSLPPRP